MKKIASFFMVFMFFAVLAAQEAKNEPVTAQTEEKENAEKAQSAEEVKAEEQAKPAEEAPAAENQEGETQNASNETEAVPAIEEKPAEPEPQEAAEETQAQPEAVPEEAPQEEPAQQQTAPEACRAEFPQDEKPSKMFYQPSLGIGIGASIFSLRINNDIDFLLKHTKNGTNVYMGLEIDFRYSPYLDDHSIYEIPIQVNMVVDFPLIHKNIKRLSLWFSAGIDLAIGYLFYYDYDDDWGDNYDRDSLFKVMPAWGMGVTMLFHNDVTLKLGFDSFYGKYPDIICATGYRF